MNDMSEIVRWTPDDMLEIRLEQPDDFLKVKETLTRMGIASKEGKNLYQSCHILHKQGRYYIVHFKELFLLDGKKSNLDSTDIKRRNTIATLLSDWGLATLVSTDPIECLPMRQVKVVSFKDKPDWNLIQKYSIGKPK